MHMKILFYDTKSYDRESFEKQLPNFPELEIKFLKTDLTPNTAPLAKGYEAVCAFVSSDIQTETINILNECGVKLILMRCAGFNNVDVQRAQECGIRTLRVPAIPRRRLRSMQWRWR